MTKRYRPRQPDYGIRQLPTHDSELAAIGIDATFYACLFCFVGVSVDACARETEEMLDEADAHGWTQGPDDPRCERAWG